MTNETVQTSHPTGSGLTAVAIIGLLLSSLSCNAFGDTGRAAFDRYLQGFATLQANFVQTVFSEEGTSLDVSQGLVYLRRPDLFRWDYHSPYVQSIIADGSTIWIYDEDLEQVTRRPIGDGPQNTPMLLLSSDMDPDEHFVVAELGESDGLLWLGLTPRDVDEQYAGMRLGFDEEGLRVMELSDNLGQITQLRFAAEKRDGELPTDLFKFTVPPGVDIVEAPAD